MASRNGFPWSIAARAWVVAGIAAGLVTGCTGAPPHEFGVARLTTPIRVDGRLDEPCYRVVAPAAGAPLERFVVAGEPGRAPPRTRAWLFWSEAALVVAFDCEDPDVVAQPPSSREHDVDAEDRVELFLWSGRADDSYACLEFGARGAVHDYRARFHRRFDDAWRASGLEAAVATDATGYRVEASLPRSLMDELGFELAAGTRLHVGLFRADFRSGAPDAPTWITWIDAQLAEPDFHVAGSFGTVRLLDAEPADTAPRR
jgi:hypothetical protein